MKKSRSMRLASALLVLTLLSTCMISGTFAKYVTSIDEVSDSARVAKWGVTGSITGEAFLDSYDLNTAVDGEFTLAVKSSTTDKVVAPGTTGTFTGVALTGTPEVAVRVETDATLTLSGWEVDGAYYCPIVITVNGTNLSGLSYDSADEFEAAVKTAIAAANADYAPNTNLEDIDELYGNYTWTWAFDGDDVKDTALGDAAAEGNAATITLAVKATVTQID